MAGTLLTERKAEEYSMSRLQLAIDQIQFARNYTIRLAESVKVEDWFRQPPAGVSHIGWQVGHLAFAEYRMALWRVRGSQPQDEHLLSDNFVRLFGANSVPDPDSARYPAPIEIRAVLDKVHEQVLRELPGLADAELDQPVPHPHRFANTKLLALMWCSHHEMVHAGQIGLLRRQLGYPPMW
jgi:hypothetical protein